MNKIASYILLSCAIVCFGYAQPVRAKAASQFPVVTRDGGTNITHIWLHKGGGRLYWNTLVYPLQIRLEGAHFVDTASVPELVTTPPPRKRHAQTRRSGRHSPRRTAQTQKKEVVQPAPADAGQTALRPPSQATSSTKSATDSSQKATPRRPAISSTTDRAAPPPVTTFTDLR